MAVTNNCAIFKYFKLDLRDYNARKIISALDEEFNYQQILFVVFFSKINGEFLCKEQLISHINNNQFF